MATCKDCIHYDVCLKYAYINQTAMSKCGDFKNKADFVDVPCRCKDCKYYKVGNLNANYCYHERYEDLSQSASYEPTDFCSYGERRDT